MPSPAPQDSIPLMHSHVSTKAALPAALHHAPHTSGTGQRHVKGRIDACASACRREHTGGAGGQHKESVEQLPGCV